MSIAPPRQKGEKVRKDLNVYRLKQDGQDVQDLQDEGHPMHRRQRRWCAVEIKVLTDLSIVFPAGYL